jgi:hypothetical protein
VRAWPAPASERSVLVPIGLATHVPARNAMTSLDASANRPAAQLGHPVSVHLPYAPRRAASHGLRRP